MRYSVKKLQIRSENAAQSPTHYSTYLKNWILMQPKVRVSIDYGCGKLRYSKYIREISEFTILVDSDIQLNRSQRIFGERRSVRDYVKNNWNNCDVISANSFSKENAADFVLCANVLSAIPSVRARSNMLRKIATCLKPRGKCLFCTQHTNSHFTKMANSPKSIKHLDGWILPSKNGASYYGIINSKKMRKILQGKFSSLAIWREGQSTYALAQK